MSRGVIAIDDGGSTIGVTTQHGQETIPSVKGLYGERNLPPEIRGKYDYVVEYKGEKYIMGGVAKVDCRLPLQMHTDSKQNLFYDLSILVAIHQFGYDENFLIVSVPITMHNNDEKNGRLLRLKKTHTITVNGFTKTFKIVDVKVAPETAVAFWINEPQGKNRFIDFGSRTVGYATTIYEDGINRFIDTESGTFRGKGLEALDQSYNQKALADYVGGKLLAIWNPNDDVWLLGGGALDGELVNHIQEYFPRASVLGNPQMSNSLGMYLLGRHVYDMA